MTNDKQIEPNTSHQVTQEALAQLGDGRLAYVRTIRSEDVASLFPEAPKIAPHLAAMKVNLARVLGIEVRRVGIKATTNERLGFLGRGEGIAAMAVASVEVA